jgi:DNA-binding transcriptional LysR family regulator
VIEVSKTGSINKAACNLFISQSVLSTSIKNLENELGQEIFSRSPRGIELTPFGKTFLSYVTPIQLQLQQLDDMLLKNMISHPQVLSIVSNGYPFISSVCANLYKKYSTIGIHIEEYEADGPEAMNFVARNIAEIGFIRQWSCYKSLYTKQFHVLNLQFYPLATLDIGVTVGPGNPLYYSESNIVTTEMLKPYPMIMYSYMDSGPYSNILDKLKLYSSRNRFVASSRINIYETLEFSDAYYLNSDYSPYNKSNAFTNASYNQRTLLLSGCDIKSEIGWIKQANTNLSPLAAEVVEAFNEHFSSVKS